MNRIGLLLSFLCLCIQVTAMTTWTGQNSSDYNDILNWDNGLPENTNPAFIPLNVINAPIISSDLIVDYDITLESSLTISNGAMVMFTGNNFLQSGQLVLDSGTAFMIDNGTFILQVGGSIISDGSFSNFASLENQATIQSNFMLINSGNWLNMPNSSLISNGDISNTGAITNQGQIFNNEGTLTNNGLIENLDDFFNVDILINNGTFNSIADSDLINTGNWTNFSAMNLSGTSTFQNQQQFTNMLEGFMSINGAIENTANFINTGTISILEDGTVANFLSFINNGFIINNGIFFTALCAVTENNNSVQNDGEVNNSGFFYQIVGSSYEGNPINNVGGYEVINDTADFCMPVTVSVPDSNTSSSVNVSFFIDSNFDLCTDFSAQFDNGTMVWVFDCDMAGANEVGIILTDNNGNSLNCTTTVMVTADAPANIDCPADVSVDTDLGVCTNDQLVLDMPSAIDICGGNAFFTNDAPTSYDVGMTTVNWFINTPDGEEMACSQNVTVTDNEAPSISCENIFIALDENCDIPSDDLLEPTASDNCGIADLSNNAPVDLPFGSSAITWTATDTNGNTSTCIQTISITDTSAPEFDNCPENILVELGNLSCETSVDWIIPIATDNCQLETISNTHTPGETFAIGEHLVQYIATDAAGNSSACLFNVTVENNTLLNFVNCPVDIELAAAGTAIWEAPTLSAPCGATLSSNFNPGDSFGTGTTTIEYIASATNGNTVTCSFDIIVLPAFETQECADDFSVSIEDVDDISYAAWNIPVAEGTCDYCENTDLEGYSYLGEFAGHQYFLYDIDRVLWFNTEILIQDTHPESYLAVIDNEAENAFLTERLQGLEPAAWIGLSDWQNEGEYVWQNGETATYTNWAENYPHATSFYNFAVLTNNGDWEDISGFMSNYFILERPCVNITPLGNAINSGSFEEGQHTINYLIQDPCGDEYVCSFDIHVSTDNVDYCASSGDGNIWIDTFQTVGYQSITGNNNGYSDETNNPLCLADDDCLLHLIPGGEAENEIVYWRIWIDFNKDGDFYDEDELVLQRWGAGTTSGYLDLPFNLETPTGPLQMRIALSQYDFVEACGDFRNGEVEDYIVEIVPNAMGMTVANNLTFIAEKFEQKVDLNWLVDENIPVNHYEVEKSIDGEHFTFLNQLDAWNSSENEWYRIVDPNPSMGDNFYRLKTVYADNTISYSDVRYLLFARDLTAFHLFPNPTTDYVYVHLGEQLGQNGLLQIVNNFGQIIYEQALSEMTTEDIKIDVRQQRAGIYSIALKTDGRRLQTQNFVLVK